jgi:hypothetical protein
MIFARRIAMPHVFTPEFWKAQWDAVIVAPWLIIPLLALVGYVGWRLRGSVDDGEIRGLKAQISARDAQLDLARDQQQDVNSKLQQVNTNLTLLRQQVQTRQPAAVILGTANSTSALVVETSVVNQALGVTLNPTGGIYRLGVPDRVTKPSE